jgi:hypothetical protein
MAAAHTTFTGLFSDASHQFLMDGRYQALLDPFNVDATVNNLQPIAVCQMIAASANQHLPIALLALVVERLMPLRSSSRLGVTVPLESTSLPLRGNSLARKVISSRSQMTLLTSPTA